MTRAVKIRLLTFVVLAAVGIVYVAGSYLGLVDRVLGRELRVHATLPSSGGLFVGSEVTYRGVKVGKVSRMDVIPSGVRLDLTLRQGTRVPKTAPIYVHNLSAVGEQYLDFEPSSNEGPFARNGDTFQGSTASLPESEEDLLRRMSSFVGSVNDQDLATTVSELGTMFRGTGLPLRHMVDSGTEIVDQARAHQAATVRLIDSSRTVLGTQEAHASDIRSFAHDLADLSGTLRTSDADIRTILQGGPPAANEVNSLLKGVQPTLPVFIGNLVTVNQVLTARLPAVEQTLVTFPRVISSGFSGTPGDGYGHINLQYNNNVPPCTKGYLPPSRWRRGTDTTDRPIFPARCLSGPPYVQRGVRYAPTFGSSGNANRVAPYDASTGLTTGADGEQVRLGSQGGLDSVFGSNAWQWMLIGPVGWGR